VFEKLMVKIYGTDWKSSLNGDLNLIKAAAVTLSGVLIITPSSPRWMIYLSLACTVISGGGQAALGRIMTDAGSVLAKVPGTKEPQIVPSHEIPDDPKAKVQ
jgi:hypothetical protein